MEKKSKASRGELVAEFLSGAWRIPPDPLTCLPAELAAIAGLLTASGAGALAWCKIRRSSLRTLRIAHQFQQAYRLHSLQAALHVRRLKQAISILRCAGVEPVLVKGWAAARLYPEFGMRPYGDLDLCVRREQYEAAREALKSPQGRGCSVDLHLEFGKFCDSPREDIFARSEVARLDDLEVRVLCPEDHLRLLCMHLLRHGAVRAIWLCDIAALLERQTGDFDWDQSLSGSRRQADWVACAVGLAHRLLHVNIEEGTPVWSRAQALPSWLAPAVLQAWGDPFRPRGQLATYLRYPGRFWIPFLKELPRHWPNPIEATIGLKRPFSEWPRLPFQLAHVISRTAVFLAGLPRQSEVPVHRSH